MHQGVTFDLFKDEILGLFGGSGSGKSVILRSIIGLEQPDQGEIWFENQDLTKLSERELLKIRPHIGYVFQNGALFDSLTVGENLAYPLHEHTDLGETKIRERVQEMLKLIDMPEATELLPSQLSGGMQKRAGLARAIILNPKLILFDEPTAGLDPANTLRLLENIRTLKRTRGITGIFVTHDIPSAFDIANRIAILSEGKIPVLDTVDAIRKSKDPLVLQFTQEALRHGK